uniref:Uncharacterized protein n=1 Tax=Candidatus Kentrum sp. FW TaxID=2126338 RepID=A0A450S521_9GAMM|nr:MAG: hypothetical protein BECKFW1821A_GA0114235_101435 [Candidatus Kentron sp. FW]
MIVNLFISRSALQIDQVLMALYMRQRSEAWASPGFISPLEKKFPSVREIKTPLAKSRRPWIVDELEYVGRSVWWSRAHGDRLPKLDGGNRFSRYSVETLIGTGFHDDRFQGLKTGSEK